MAKQKLFSVKKEVKVFGDTLDGVTLISNGHWMARQELVGVTVEMAATMETAGYFASRNGEIKPSIKPPSFKIMAGSFTIPELFPVTVLATLNDASLFIFENTLFKGFEALSTEYLPPFDGCQAYRADVLDPEKPIRFYRNEVFQGLIMPLRRSFPGSSEELIRTLMDNLPIL